MQSLPRTAPQTREAFYRVARDFSVEALAEGPVAEMAREALRSCGKLQQRKCPLQPLFVLWFLLARHLFPGDSLTTLFSRLSRALRGRLPDLGDRMVTDGALCHARDRLGAEPLDWLLRALADVPGPRFHHRRVLALDGVRLDLPDTPTNVRAFGRRCGRLGASPWPQALALVLLEVATHIPRDARVAHCDSSEKTIGRDLLSSVGTEDILLLDAGFYGVPVFLAVEARGAGFLCPVPRHVLFGRRGPKRVHGRFTDYTATLRSKVVLPNGRTKTLWMEVRVIEERRPGFRTRRYVTNLPASISAEEVVQLYRERWEVEMAFDEIKTVLCHPPAGASPTELRSKSPEGVRQETLALLCAYSLIRRAMVVAAQAGQKDPRNLSFTAALACIAQTATTMLAAPASHLLDLYDRMLRDIAACTLRRTGTPRRCRRELKRKATKYPLKHKRRGAAA